MGRNAMNSVHAKLFCLNAKQTTRPSMYCAKHLKNGKKHWNVQNLNNFLEESQKGVVKLEM